MQVLCFWRADFWQHITLDVALLNVKNFAPLQPLPCGLSTNVHAGLAHHALGLHKPSPAQHFHNKAKTLRSWTSRVRPQESRHYIRFICFCVCVRMRSLVALFEGPARRCLAIQRQRQTHESDWWWERRARGQLELARRGQSRLRGSLDSSQKKKTLHLTDWAWCRKTKDHLGITSAGLGWSAQKLKQPERRQWR